MLNSLGRVRKMLQPMEEVIVLLCCLQPFCFVDTANCERNGIHEPVQCCEEWSDASNKTICSRCETGFHGSLCELACRYPSYGKLCQSMCDCEEMDCHHVHGCRNASEAGAQ
ncbi:uncharacterized protein LOC111110902 [Crassostrea virginica]